MDELTRIIANNITQLRVANKITQLELAQKLNYSDKLVSKWERADAAPNAQTLKALSEIFGVSVDYLFTDHKGSVPKAPTPERKLGKRIIIAVSIIGIYLLALLIFVIFWILGSVVPAIFVYALPAALITYLVLNSVWNGGRFNHIIIALLVASIALTVYIALLKFNCWQIFLLLIPAEIIVFLTHWIKRK